MLDKILDGLLMAAYETNVGPVNPEEPVTSSDVEKSKHITHCYF